MDAKKPNEGISAQGHCDDAVTYNEIALDSDTRRDLAKELPSLAELLERFPHLLTELFPQGISVDQPTAEAPLVARMEQATPYDRDAQRAREVANFGGIPTKLEIIELDQR